MLKTVANQIDSGTFVPTIEGATVPGAQTYVVQAGFWTRIGNRVFYNLRIVLATKDVLMAGTVVIKGLPFLPLAAASNNSAAAVSNVGFIDLSAGYSQLTAHMESSGSEIYLNQLGDNIAASYINSAAIQANTRFVISGNYVVA
jgi:hypothetical protein